MFVFLLIVIAVIGLFYYYTSRETKPVKNVLTTGEKEIVKWNGNFKKPARIIALICLGILVLSILSNIIVRSINSSYLKSEEKAKQVYEEASKLLEEAAKKSSEKSEEKTKYIEKYAKDKGTYKGSSSYYSSTYYVDSERVYSFEKYNNKFKELSEEAKKTDEYKKLEEEASKVDKEYEKLKSNKDKKEKIYKDKQENARNFRNNSYSYITASITAILLSIVVSLVTMILYFYLSKMEITVTNKRVFGKKAFGKRIDLPLDTISAVGTSFIKGIDVGTSSGRIHFKGIKNNVEIHTEICKLLNARQK